MIEPLKSTQTAHKGSLFYFLNDNKNILAQFIGIGLLLLLLVPFYKTLIISVIFYAGFNETRRMVHGLPKVKRWIFKTIFYAVISGFVFLVYWIVDKATQISIVSTKSGTQKNLFNRFEKMFNSNIEGLEKWIVSVFSNLNKTEVHEQFIQGMQSVLESSLNWTINFFSDLPMLALQIGFFIAAIIWFSYHRGKSFNFLNSILRKHFSDRQAHVFWSMVEECSYQTLICTFLVSFVQAGILGLAAIVLGLPAWPFIFLIAFIFSFFPVVGTLPASLLGIAMAYSQDGVSSATIFLGAALVTSVADNFLRTWLISSQESVMPSSFNFFAIVGGIALFGFSGVFIGPFFLAIATALLKKGDV